MIGNLWRWLWPFDAHGAFTSDIGHFGSLLALCVVANMVVWVVLIVLNSRQERRMTRRLEDLHYAVRRMAKTVTEIRTAQQNIAVEIGKVTVASTSAALPKSGEGKPVLADLREGLKQLRAEMEPEVSSDASPANDSSASQAAE